MSVYITPSFNMLLHMNKSVNWTLDGETHKLLGIVARKNGLTKIGMLRTLVVNEANNFGTRIPKALQEYGY